MELRTNKELRAASRMQLKGNWVAAILMLVVIGVISALLIIPFVGAIINLIVISPLTLGLAFCYLNLVRGKTFKIEDVFSGFSNLGPAIVLRLVSGIFIALWSLLFIIPGIIAKLRYSMAIFILNDNPDLGALEAIRISKKWMIGYKGQLFLLYLSFIGWYLLCILTLGIGFLWLLPYVKATEANFYEDLRKSNLPKSL